MKTGSAARTENTSYCINVKGKPEKFNRSKHEVACTQFNERSFITQFNTSWRGGLGCENQWLKALNYYSSRGRQYQSLSKVL